MMYVITYLADILSNMRYRIFFPPLIFLRKKNYKRSYQGLQIETEQCDKEWKQSNATNYHLDSH